MVTGMVVLAVLALLLATTTLVLALRLRAARQEVATAQLALRGTRDELWRRSVDGAQDLDEARRAAADERERRERLAEEVRTSLATAMGFAEVLVEPDVEEPRRRHALQRFREGVVATERVIRSELEDLAAVAPVTAAPEPLVIRVDRTPPAPVSAGTAAPPAQAEPPTPAVTGRAITRRRVSTLPGRA